MKEIQVAIVGDIAWNEDRTPWGEQISPGGAAYYSAVGASRFSQQVGVVARIGGDFDKKLLTKKGVNVEGVREYADDKTCRFVLIQHEDNTREFSANRGVAAVVDTTIFPDSYRSASYLHFPTQLPEHVLTWINNFPDRKNLSVDTFEQFIKEYPELTKEMLARASLIFINEEELKALRQLGELSFNVPVILKMGKDGAAYIDRTEYISIPAPKVIAIDTTGAGDVLAGAYLAQRSMGSSVINSLFNAVRLASNSVTEFGVEHVVPEKEIK